MRELGYMSCPVDPDLWLKEQTDQKGRKYYSYILCYIDDLLVVHHRPKHIMHMINSFLPLKHDLVGLSEMYLGAKLKRKTFQDGTLAWGLPPPKYAQQAVRNVETYPTNNLEERFSLPKQGDNPFPCDYGPKEDGAQLL